MCNELAARLANLKDRTDRSYAALARQIGVSSSALHRYCTGTGVPGDFRVVQRMGRTCGADRRELVGLHQAWVVAVARRHEGNSRSGEPLVRPGTGYRRRIWLGAAAVTAMAAVLTATWRYLG